jgi:hypothetical protein
MNTKLYVLTTIFNPFQFESRYRLYRQFAQHMAESGADVELATVEVAFGHEPFKVTEPGHPLQLQLRTNQILWLKESSLNLLARHVLQSVPDLRYFAWIDADVRFTNYRWAKDAVHKLTYVPVIQPFATAINLDRSGDPMWNCPSAFRAFIEGRGYHQEPPLPVSYTYKGHPGLAWCCTREIWEQMGGLYDRCVAGSADSVMSNAFKGDYSVYLPAPPSEGMHKSMAAWQAKALAATRGHVGFVRGSLLHYWHGPSEKRGYEKRWSVLSFHQFDPATDLVADETSGLWRWAGNKPKLEDDIRLSLGARDEDS